MGEIVQWQSICFTCRKSQVQSSASPGRDTCLKSGELLLVSINNIELDGSVFCFSIITSKQKRVGIVCYIPVTPLKANYVSWALKMKGGQTIEIRKRDISIFYP